MKRGGLCSKSACARRQSENRKDVNREKRSVERIGEKRGDLQEKARDAREDETNEDKRDAKRERKGMITINHTIF